MSRNDEMQKISCFYSCVYNMSFSIQYHSPANCLTCVINWRYL